MQASIRMRRLPNQPNTTLTDANSVIEHRRWPRRLLFVNSPCIASRRQAATTLAGLERDLFETLIENPELAAMAVEAIDPDWFETTTAKMLLVRLPGSRSCRTQPGRRLGVAAGRERAIEESDRDAAGTDQPPQRPTLPQGPDERYAAIMTRYRELAFSRREIEADRTTCFRGTGRGRRDGDAEALIDEERTQARHQTQAVS